MRQVACEGVPTAPAQSPDCVYLVFFSRRRREGGTVCGGYCWSCLHCILFRQPLTLLPGKLLLSQDCESRATGHVEHSLCGLGYLPQQYLGRVFMKILLFFKNVFLGCFFFTVDSLVWYVICNYCQGLLIMLYRNTIFSVFVLCVCFSNNCSFSILYASFGQKLRNHKKSQANNMQKEFRDGHIPITYVN